MYTMAILMSMRSVYVGAQSQLCTTKWGKSSNCKILSLPPFPYQATLKLPQALFQQPATGAGVGTGGAGVRPVVPVEPVEPVSGSRCPVRWSRWGAGVRSRCPEPIPLSRCTRPGAPANHSDCRPACNFKRQHHIGQAALPPLISRQIIVATSSAFAASQQSISH